MATRKMGWTALWVIYLIHCRCWLFWWISLSLSLSLPLLLTPFFGSFLSVGHKGRFGHEFLEFEIRPDGMLRYANNSNYKKDSMIRKEGQAKRKRKEQRGKTRINKGEKQRHKRYLNHAILTTSNTFSLSCFSFLADSPASVSEWHYSPWIKAYRERVGNSSRGWFGVASTECRWSTGAWSCMWKWAHFICNNEDWEFDWCRRKSRCRRVEDILFPHSRFTMLHILAHWITFQD